MITVTVTDQARYRVEYRLEGVLCSIIECAELTSALQEVEHKMRMDMGHVKGKKFTIQTGREI